MKKLFIIFAILCLAAPAMAADWNFYGSSRMATFRVDVDPDVSGVDSDTDTQWGQNGNSRIGANVMFNDEIGGRFEYGHSADNVSHRILYGTYKFGSSELLLGQTYTPVSSQFYSNSVYDADGDLLGVGQFYVGRKEMIQWSIAGFKLALVEPNVVSYTGYDDEDVDLPKIEIGYKFKSDMFYFDVFAGYQTYTLDGAVNDIDIDSYLLGGGVGANFGPIFAKIGAHMGQNLGNYGAYNPVGLSDAAAINATATDVNDSDGLGYLAVVGFNASEMFVIEAGYGHEEAEVDTTNNTEEADQYYVNCTVNIAPGFFVVPEVGMIKYSDDVSAAEPEVFYWGAKWQINF